MTQPEMVDFPVELEREVDGRWIAEVPSIPGAIVYGTSADAAVAAVRRLAADVIDERRAHGEPIVSDTRSLTMAVGQHVARRD